LPRAESGTPSVPSARLGGRARPPAEQTRARPFMRLGALVYLYRRRLRVHGVQELLAGLGIASSVALVFATLVASGSVAGSSAQLVHEVIGPATLQLRARSADGFNESMLGRVERLAGVKQAAPLLEQTATIEATDTLKGTPHGGGLASGYRLTVSLAGADTALTVLDGLAHTLPRETLASGAVGLSQASAQTLGIPTTASRQSGISLARDTPGVPAPANARASAGELSASSSSVTLLLRGQARRQRISDVLGAGTIGPLAAADVAVMPLEDLQRLAGLQGRITRVLVLAQPGREAQVRRELETLAGGRIEVAAANQDVGLLSQALRPSDEASTLFATISVLLGVLFAFGALLLTVPERRRAIADLRLLGTRRSAIVQMLLFQALCLGVAASLVGLLGGYVLSRSVLQQSSGYLDEAFTLGSHTLIGIRPALEAALAGVLATCVASAVPLLDLRHSASLDAVYRAEGSSGTTLSHSSRRWLAVAATLPLAAATFLFATDPANALLTCELLALATVLAVPLTFAAVLRGGRALAERRQRLTVLPVALASLQGTKLRSLALAGTGALALFGAVALGGARADLLRGVQRFAHSYAAEANIWVGAPGDNQATVDFRASGLATRISHVQGVADVQSFQGGFVQLDTENDTPSGGPLEGHTLKGTPHGEGQAGGGRRAWLLARPAADERELLDGQVVAGNLESAVKRLRESGWVAVSAQIAEAAHVGVGGTLLLPTPSGNVPMRVAATTSNLAWSPGAIVMNEADYSRLWATTAPTALDVRLVPGADSAHVLAQVRAALGPASGLRATSARAREASIDALIGEGLSRLQEISLLLLLAATIAMAAALSSAIWQRRVSLATLRLSGVRPARIRMILVVESMLMLGAGCITGVLAGLYGQLVIDAYLRHVTGFPVASLAASPRPIEILALVIAAVLAIVALPAWLASRVSPTLALNE
jgi:putative ABC transport system permease protein